MTHLLIGLFMMAGFLRVVNYSRNKKLHITWWQWILTILCFIYGVFVLEIILSFLSEGSARGALVMGLLMGFIAVVWSVLLGRFVFAKSVK